MSFIDILLILIVIVIVAYVAFMYLRSQRDKDIQELQNRKDEMLAVPIADQLYTLQNMDLSGKTKRNYESLAAKWQTLINFKFTEIESTLVGAEQFADQLNLIKAKNTLQEADQMIEETENEVSELHDEISQLLEVEGSNAKQSEELLTRLNSVRKTIMNHSFDYGPAIETLEKNLQYLELNFTKYNEVTTNGDYLEARDILKGMESDLATLEEILDKIPAMYDTIKNEYEDSLEDLRQGYERMLTSHFVFTDDHVLEEIDQIQEHLNEAKSYIKNADLIEAKTLMDKSDRDIDSLYDFLESEIEAREYVHTAIPKIQQQFEAVVERNRYASVEVDRISQSYILHSNQLDQIDSLKAQLQKDYEKLQELTTQLDEGEVVYSKLSHQLQQISKGLASIDQQQESILQSLIELNQSEREAKQQLDDFELDLRNLKRQIEKHHLPGLSEDYYHKFYQVTEEIEYLSQRMNRVRIDMEEVHMIIDELSTHLDELNKMTEEIIDNAMLTEQMIQHSNRFRYDFDDVDAAIQEAQYLFYKEYRYSDALAVIERALRRVDQEGPTLVRRMYHQDKQNQF